MMGTEYSRAIGTMVIDELAEVNGQVSMAVNSLKAKNEELEADLKDMDS